MPGMLAKVAARARRTDSAPPRRPAVAAFRWLDPRHARTEDSGPAKEIATPAGTRTCRGRSRLEVRRRGVRGGPRSSPIGGREPVARKESHDVRAGPTLHRAGREAADGERSNRGSSRRRKLSRRDKTKLINELRKASPAFNDRWLYRWVVWTLGAVAIASVIGVIVLAALDKTISEGLVALGGGCGLGHWQGFFRALGAGWGTPQTRRKSPHAAPPRRRPRSVRSTPGSVRKSV